MTRKERMRRADPARTEPIRHFDQLFQQSETGGFDARHTGGDGAPGPDTDGTGDRRAGGTNGAGEADGHARGQFGGAGGRAFDDAVTEAVRMGYRIIDEHITQGQRVAEEIAGGDYSSSAAGGDAAEFARRALQLYADFGATCFDFVESLSGKGELQNALRDWLAALPLGAASARAPAPGPSASPLPIEIASVKPARVSLELSPAAANAELAVPGLYSVDPARPPLRDVRFIAAAPGVEASLSIRVPADQPADTYAGAVIDLATREPCGTLSIQIRDPQTD
jgi:hypothetical protein